MNNWRSVSMADLARIRSGYAFKSSQWTSSGIAVVKIANVKAGEVDLAGCAYVNPADAAQSRFPVSKGDILIGLTGYVGEVARFRSDQPAVLNQRVGKFFPGKQCHPDFLYFLVSSAEFRARVEAASHGSAQANVSPRDIEQFQIFVPPFEEQSRIASVLQPLDDKIELNRRTNETLEAIAQAIFRDWFVDFGPVRRKLEGTTDPVEIMGGLVPDPARAAGLAGLFPDAMKEGEIPVGWRLGDFGDLATTAGGSVDPTRLTEDTPYIGLEHMPRRSITLDSWEYAGKVSSQKSRFSSGQVLFGKLRPYFHKVGIAPVDGVCSTDIVVLDSRADFDRGLVACCASSDAFVAFTDLTSSGTKMPRTSWSHMKTYELAIADAPVRRAFSGLVGPMHQKIVSSVAENRTLVETRDYLLPRLMSGEVRVGDPSLEIAI